MILGVTQLVTGTYFGNKLVISHPINFGMPKNSLPMFRNSSHNNRAHK
jgi:hypothetical protein